MRGLDIVVVIVSYKCAEFTVACLGSIERDRAASRMRIRVVVVDNASGDYPVIARAISENNWTDWVTLIAAPRNGGFAYGNNLGVRHACRAATPDYIYLLNPDTEVRAGAVESVATFLEDNPQVGIAGSSIENPDGSDWALAFRFPNLVSEMIAALEFGVFTRLFRRWDVAMRMDHVAQRVDWVSGAAMMIRGSVFIALDGLDESYFLYFEEVDFCRRARDSGFPAWYVPQSRIMHIQGTSTNVTGAKRTLQRRPAYWFESRRRFFVLTYGVRRAMVIDAAALVAHCLGWLKRAFLRRSATTPPHFIRDLIRHSVLRPTNRRVLPFCGLSSMTDDVSRKQPPDESSVVA